MIFAMFLMMVPTFGLDPNYIRIINVFLAVIATGAFLANYINRRSELVRRVRRLLLYLFGFIVITGYGSGRAYAAHAPLLETVFFFAANLFGLIFALFWHPDGDDKLPPYDGSAGQAVIDWLNYHVRGVRK